MGERELCADVGLRFVQRQPTHFPLATPTPHSQYQLPSPRPSPAGGEGDVCRCWASFRSAPAYPLTTSHSQHQLPTRNTNSPLPSRERGGGEGGYADVGLCFAQRQPTHSPLPTTYFFFNAPTKYCPVTLAGFIASCSGVPVAIICPPPAPPSGPRSTIQSAVLMTSRLCSMITTVLP
jgi:hypothetical protein